MLVQALAVAVYAAHSVVVRREDKVHTEIADDSGNIFVQGLEGEYSYFKQVVSGGRTQWWVMAMKKGIVTECEAHPNEEPVVSTLLQEFNYSDCEMHEKPLTVRNIDAYCLMQATNVSMTMIYFSEADMPLRVVQRANVFQQVTFELFRYKEANNTEPLVLPSDCTTKYPRLVSPEKYSGTLEVITEDSSNTESLTMWRNVVFDNYQSQAYSGGSKKVAYSSLLGHPHLALWDTSVDIRRRSNATTSQYVPGTKQCDIPVTSEDLFTSTDAYFSGVPPDLGTAFKYEGRQTVRDQECSVWSVDQRGLWGIRIFIYQASLRWKRRSTGVSVFMDGNHTYHLAKWQGINAMMARSHHMHFFKPRVGNNVLAPEIIGACNLHDVCHMTCAGIICEQEIQLAFQLKVLVGSALAAFAVSFVITLLSLTLMTRHHCPAVHVEPPELTPKELGTSAPPPCLPMPDIQMQELLYETDDSA